MSYRQDQQIALNHDYQAGHGRFGYGLNEWCSFLLHFIPQNGHFEF